MSSVVFPREAECGTKARDSSPRRKSVRKGKRSPTLSCGGGPIVVTVEKPSGMPWGIGLFSHDNKSLFRIGAIGPGFLSDWNDRNAFVQGIICSRSTAVPIYVVCVSCWPQGRNFSFSCGDLCATLTPYPVLPRNMMHHARMSPTLRRWVALPDHRQLLCSRLTNKMR